MNPLSTTDQALCAYLISQGVGSDSNIVPYKRSAEKEAPIIICACPRAVPVDASGATYEVDAMVFVRTTAAVDVDDQETDPPARNADLVTLVMNALHKFGDGEQSGGILADAITNAARGDGLSDFTCQTVEISSIEQSIERPQSGTITDGWTDTISLKLVVCPADVS